MNKNTKTTKTYKKKTPNNFENLNFEFDIKDINCNNMDNTTNMNNQNNQNNQNNMQNINLGEIFKTIEQIFSNPQTLHKITNTDKKQNDDIIHIRKNSIVKSFELQIKKQLNDIVNTSKNKRENTENYGF